MIKLDKNPKKLLKQILDELEEGIDPGRQEDIRSEYLKALNLEPVDKPPLAFSYPPPSNLIRGLGESLDKEPITNDNTMLNWVYSPEERFYDPTKMLINQLLVGFGSIFFNDRIGDQLPYTIRGNFGTGIVSSIFGANIRFTSGNPPWASGDESIDYYLDQDHLDLSRGMFGRVINRYEFYNDILSDYPDIKKILAIVLPDLQGPLDVAEQLTGGKLYLKMIQDPEKVWKLLRKISETIVKLVEEIKPLTNEHLPRGYTHQHGIVIKGNILIREDSAINLSKDMYREQILPHNEFIIEKVGGGGVHFCGDGGHLINEMASSKKIQCVDVGQPKMLNIEKIYQELSNKKIPLLRVRLDEDELVKENISEKYPTGVILRHRALSIDRANFLSENYFN